MKSEWEFTYRPDKDGTIAEFFAKRTRAAFRAGNKEEYEALLSAAEWNCFSLMENRHGLCYVYEDRSWLWVEKGILDMSETIVPPFANTQSCGMGGKGCVCVRCYDDEAVGARAKERSAKRNSRKASSRRQKDGTAPPSRRSAA
jgi:hypothetical protein